MTFIHGVTKRNSDGGNTLYDSLANWEIASEQTNNIDSDPLFEDPDSGNLNLQQGSGCIDSGTDVGASDEDYEGTPRPRGDGYDIGAFEYKEAGVRGDDNGDGVIAFGDVVYLIDYLFKSGPSPDPLWIGDVIYDEVLDIEDVVYLIKYLFKGGPPP